MTEILFPVGRMIGGSMYTAQPRTNDAGQPVLGKDGQPEKTYSFGVAIPKAGEQHWNQTEWGAQIYQIGQAAYPGQCLAPTFAWKITDGDSNIPNKKGRVPRDQEGYVGNWVIWFSQGWAPRLCDTTGSDLLEPEAIMPGYFVQVYADVVANKPRPGASHTPGLYMNPLATARVAYGQRIQASSVDTKSVAWSAGAALPPGATTAPVSTFSPAPVPQPQGYTPPVTTLPAAPVAPPPVPNTAFLQPPPAPVHLMTPAANGASYEDMIKAGWTDALLIQHGMMLQ